MKSSKNLNFEGNSNSKLLYFSMFFYSMISPFRGGSKISENWAHMYKGVGVRFSDFISFFFNIP